MVSPHDSDNKAIAPQKTINEQPGGLRSETRMTIQTRQAQKLVTGRKRAKGVQPIIGLLDYGRRMKLLWLSAQANDPYADLYLIKIEESIDETKQLIKEKKQWLDDVLNSMPGFDIDIAQSMQPIQVSIVFQNPYGYMGAYLISEYDELCCSVFTASHIGLIDRKTASSLIEAAGKLIRRTFDMAAKWKFTGVTRDDIKASNPVGLGAIETYGACPEPILSASKRAKIAPEIRENASKVKVTLKKKKTVQKIKDEKAQKPEEVTDAKPKTKKGTTSQETVAKSLFGMA